MRLRLALQPALHRVADLLRRGGVRQADVQRQLRHAGQARRRRRVEHRAGGARVEQHDHACSPRNGSMVPSRQSMRARPAAARARAVPAACAGSSRSFPQRRLDLAHADPARRADRQAFGADDEADAAPARAAQFVGDALAVQRAVRAPRADGRKSWPPRTAFGAAPAAQRGANGRDDVAVDDVSSNSEQLRGVGVGAAIASRLVHGRRRSLGVEAAHLGFDPGLDLAHQLVGLAPGDRDRPADRDVDDARGAAGNSCAASSAPRSPRSARSACRWRWPAATRRVL